MVRCLGIAELLGEYLDRALDPATAAALEAHLADCQECRAFLNTYRRTVRTTGDLREEALPESLRQRLVAFLGQQDLS